jgi:hypothetical protein
VRLLIRVPSSRLVALLLLAGPACTTLIGLPDLPDRPAEGKAGNAGSPPTSAGGVSGAGHGGNNAAATSGASSAAPAGGSTSGEAGQINEGAGTSGTPPCGMACAGSVSAMGGGSSGVGGNVSGGTGGTGGAGGSGGRAGNSGGGTGGSSGGTGGQSGAGGISAAGSGGNATCTPACPNNVECLAGTCGCSGGMTRCGDYCVDTQMDATHCGSCDATCAGGCTAGRCYLQLDDGTGRHVGNIAATSSDVYFTRGQELAVYTVPIAGGTVHTAVVPNQNPYGVAVDTSTLYWLDPGTVSSGGDIGKQPFGGSASYLVTNEENLSRLTVDSTYVYYGTTNNSNILYRIPIAGGTKDPIATGDNATSVMNLFTDTTRLYWTSDGNGGSILSYTLAGGEMATLASGLLGLSNEGWTDLAGPQLYFMYLTTGNAQELARVNADGVGGVTTITSVSGANMMAADSTGIYVSSNSDKTIVKMNLDGSNVKTLVHDFSGIDYIKLIGNNLFYFNGNADLRVTSATP